MSCRVCSVQMRDENIRFVARESSIHARMPNFDSDWCVFDSNITYYFRVKIRQVVNRQRYIFNIILYR